MSERCKNCDRPEATNETAYLPIGPYVKRDDIPVCFAYTERLRALERLVEADEDDDLDWNRHALWEQASADCQEHTVNWYEEALRLRACIAEVKADAEVGIRVEGSGGGQAVDTLAIIAKHEVQP